MKFITLIFLIVITCLCMTFSQGSYEDCCLKYVTKLRPSMHKMARSYRIQKLDGGCNIPAIVFSMKRGKMFCADPKAAWAQKLMKLINRHNKKAIKG
ncbi:C-C motif chemokine 25 [Engraulis encrasicolus]|uniref:C-C motif chemokine 25 n=1 Tax=Engraulis encrasicolus TaxID=184585 RepID=UPI002FD760C0